jgi:hypothetical protein
VVAPEPLTPRARVRDNQFAVLSADRLLQHWVQLDLLQGVRFVPMGRTDLLGRVPGSRIGPVGSQVTTAVIAFGGVIVGAAIAAFVGDLRPNVRTVRGVARMLHDDLDAYRHDHQAPLPTALWADRCELLASELSLSDWEAVRSGYAAASKQQAAQASGKPLKDGEETEANAKLDAALKVLASLSGRWPWIMQTARRSGI